MPTPLTTPPRAVPDHTPTPWRWMQSLFAFIALLAAAVLAVPAHAFCGFYAGKADSSLYNEASQVVMVRDGDKTVISMLNDYKGPLNEFVLVVPTPVALQKGQVRVAEKAIFERLDAFSSPRMAEYFDANPCEFNFSWGNNQLYRMSPPPPHTPIARMRMEKGAARDAALGVTVEARYTLEEYDIVSLSAKQSDGLETWLLENGYKVPKGASAALAPYIKQGMKFFLAKVNLKEKDRLGYNYLRPLQFAFDSEKFMLPMRLGMVNAEAGKAQDLIIYMLTKNGRVESSNYRTLKLPTDVNLPPFIKPKFGEFYKAMFAEQVRKEDMKALFTEYFWDMGWCDPCAADPLSRTELRKAGVFWLDEEQGSPSAKAQPGGRPFIMPPGGGAQPVQLTRLHLRYTPQSLSEDLSFVQTQDKQNWQTRFVLQQPYKSTVAQCSADLQEKNCAALCKTQVGAVLEYRKSPHYNESRDESETKKLADKDLTAHCIQACTKSKRSALDAALRYYNETLPTRLRSEKLTLAKLTGWNPAQIDQMPGAMLPEAPQTAPPGSVDPTHEEPAQQAPKKWWEKLFSSLAPSALILALKSFNLGIV